MRSFRLLLLLGIVATCTRDTGVEPLDALPVVRALDVRGNPHNVLSATLRAEVLHADSARIRFGTADGPLDQQTPAVPADGDTLVLSVLGLLPATEYRLQVLAWRHGRFTAGDALSFTTAALPDDLPRFVAAGTDPAPGYVLVTSGLYALALDNLGRVTWYRRFATGAGLNFQAQPTGSYTLHPPGPEPLQRAWIELDALGTVLRTLECASGLQARFHDLILLEDGSYWIMCDDVRTVDLGGIGGARDARVTATAVQHVARDGTVRFHWTAFDHFDIADLPPLDRADRQVNWTHGNAIDFDHDGNLLISFRNLGEVTKIDVRTGAVLWRLGGARSGFTFEGTSAPPFTGQHSVRVTRPGELLLLDNLGDPQASRAERYVLDEARRTARLAHAYSSLPPVIGPLGGSVQDLGNGRTLVSFGNGGRVAEYDATGAVVWQLEGSAYIFRAQRIRSLYHPGRGDAR